jgi:ketosteroid isomerase-like protein
MTTVSVHRFILGLALSTLLANSWSASAEATTERTAATSTEMLALLDEFAQAWNRHDVDALVSMMTDDCIFDASSGSTVEGARYEGRAAVRAAFAAVFERFSDAHWGGARHVVSGERGFSEWTFTGTLDDGTRVEVNGCDLFTFRDGKIAVKNSFRKNRTPPAQ